MLDPEQQEYEDHQIAMLSKSEGWRVFVGLFERRIDELEKLIDVGAKTNEPSGQNINFLIGQRYELKRAIREPQEALKRLQRKGG